MEQSQSKVYLEVVEKIKNIIDENQLGPGDKLPSERDLTEILKAGRSSVREALRALELLGLIETRRGEGTFVADFRNHRLVELLSGFILQSSQAKNDVSETKQLIEIISIYKIIQQQKQLDLSLWKDKKVIQDDHFFDYLIIQTDNYLLTKIWRILVNFEKSLDLPVTQNDLHIYLRFIDTINNGKQQEALHIYKNELRNQK